MAPIRPLACIALAVALVAGGCGSDDDQAPPPYLDAAKVAARELARAEHATAKAQRLLAGEPNAPRLGDVTAALDEAAAQLEESAARDSAWTTI